MFEITWHRIILLTKNYTNKKNDLFGTIITYLAIINVLEYFDFF